MVFEGSTRRHTRDAHVPRQRAGRHVGGERGLRGDLEARSSRGSTNVDRLLLEYDSDRAGTFAPLAGRAAPPPGRARAGDDEGRDAREARRQSSRGSRRRRSTCRSTGWRSARSAASPRARSPGR
jgi:hypothetical protein